MKFLRREEVGVDLVKGDPDQPRKYFNPDTIKSMAATMIHGLKKEATGLINDIELDDKYVVITGEQRFRAAKLAGKSTVMCKIFTNIDPDERYYRQGLENLTRGNMTPMEVSDWIVKVLVSMGWTPSKPGLLGQERTAIGTYSGDKYVVELAEKIGVTKQFIYEKLSHQNEKESVKEYLRKPDAKSSIIRSINQRAPDELKDTLKDKVLDGSIKNREVADELIRALVGYEDEKIPPPTVKKKLLETPYTEPTVRENLKKISEIFPEKTHKEGEIERDSELSKALSANTTQLYVLLGRLDPQKIPPTHRRSIISGFEQLIGRLETMIDLLSGKTLMSGE